MLGRKSPIERRGIRWCTILLLCGMMATTAIGDAHSNGISSQSEAPASTLTAPAASTPSAETTPAVPAVSTPWYDSCSTVLSDCGDIVYTVRREGPDVVEIWLMDKDGGNKRRLKTYFGPVAYPGAVSWVPGQRLLLVKRQGTLWGRPDFERHTIAVDAPSGLPKSIGGVMLDRQLWLLDTATGQDTLIDLGTGYDVWYAVVSPDGQQIAFVGQHTVGRYDPSNADAGLWVYSLKTRKLRKLVTGWIQQPICWSPDSRRLAVAVAAEDDSRQAARITLVEVADGRATTLTGCGWGPAFSPDGSKVAYFGKADTEGQVSLMLLDLHPDAQPRQVVAVQATSASGVHWSPDGSMLLCTVMGANAGALSPSLIVVMADGSGTREIYAGQDVASPVAVSWTPSADAVYVVTFEGVMLVAADGSGVRSDLGGNEKDSTLTPEQQAQTEGAVEALREAIFHYSVGRVRALEGRPADSRQALEAAADIFVSLATKYPLSGFGTADLMCYTDEATTLAKRPAAVVMEESCRERLSHAQRALEMMVLASARFPASLEEIEKQVASRRDFLNYVSDDPKEWANLITRCPEGEPLEYTPPAAGTHPEVGELLLACPRHPGSRFEWTERMAAALGPGPVAGMPAATPAERWRQDLQYLATQLPRRHKNLFFQLKEEQFKQSVAALDAAIPSLQDLQVIAGMMRIVASVEDAHTRLQPDRGFPVEPLPLRFYWFKDGIFVIRAIRPYERAVGARLTAVGDTPIDQVCGALAPLIPHENESQLRLASPEGLGWPGLLNALGILPDPHSAHLAFTGADGPFAMDIAAVSVSGNLEWVDPPGIAKLHALLYMKNPRSFYWYEYLPDSQTLYCQYDRCMNMPETPFADFCQELWEFADSHPVKRFVLDMRSNRGGSSPLADPLINGLKARPSINRKSVLFVIVGRRTFSSAVLNAVDLRNETNAIFVGEPTGGKPNHFGEVQTLVLPNSGMRVMYSTKYFTHSKDDTASFLPDITVEPTSSDFFEGRDPVMEAILAYPQPAPDSH